MALFALCLVITSCNKDNENDEPKETIDGFACVDLGLSVKWAANNLNGYFQYGSTKANTFTRNSDALPYNEIGGTSLDAARVNMSSKWRLPTRAEMIELVDRCTWYLITESGVRYFKVVGPSGKSITIPCSGAYPLGDETSLLYQNYQCWLMTSSLDGGGNPRPYILKACYTNETTDPTVGVTTNEALRVSGIPVRGVSSAKVD